MQSWIIKNSEMVLTVLISLMICTTRSSMALGNLIYSLIILMTLITCWYRRHEISVPQTIRQYGWAYIGMLLCVLPSALISNDIAVTTKYFFNIWVWKVLVIVPILLFIKSSPNYTPYYQYSLYIWVSMLYLPLHSIYWAII